jgi:hypothetical protein
MRFGATKLNLFLNAICIACAGFFAWQFVSKLWLNNSPSSNAITARSSGETPLVTTSHDEVQSVKAEDLRQYLNSKDGVVVDIRQRTDFNKAHIAQSINIPLDEIEARMAHEFPIDRPVYIYCHHSLTCKANKSPNAEKPDMSLCQISGVTLGWAAFHQVRFISDSLALLAAKGIPIVGDPCD